MGAPKKKVGENNKKSKRRPHSQGVNSVTLIKEDISGDENIKKVSSLVVIIFSIMSCGTIILGGLSWFVSNQIKQSEQRVISEIKNYLIPVKSDLSIIKEYDINHINRKVEIIEKDIKELLKKK